MAAIPPADHVRRPAPPAAPIIDPALLDLLLNADAPCSIDHVARERGTPRSAVVAELERLRAVGCDIQVHPQRGIALLHTGLGAWTDYLRWRCPPPTNDADRREPPAPRIIEVYRRTGSTQDAARRIVETYGPAADGAIVIADEQTAGRGRLGRRWHAPAGACLTFSLVRTRGSAGVDRLVFATAVAVARALDRAAAPVTLNIGIKWPNDLLLAGGKLSGILVETLPASSFTAAIIGVGINVHLTPDMLPDDLSEPRYRVASLAAAGCRADRLRVLAAVVAEMDLALACVDPAPLLEEWRRRSTQLSQTLRLSCDGRTVQGQVMDLDPAEGLILRCDTGEIVHLPAATTTVL